MAGGTIAGAGCAGVPAGSAVATGVSPTRNVRLATAPTLPTASVARTWNVCVPAATPANPCGEPHGPKGWSSSRQRYVAPASLAANAKAGDEPVSALGSGVTTVTDGAVTSTVNVVADASLTLPARSVALMRSAWPPSEGKTNGLPDAQLVNGAPSRLQDSRANASPVKPNVGEPLT